MTKLLITRARLFAALDETVLDDGSVLVQGDRITWSGPTADLPSGAGDGAEVHDVGGKFDSFEATIGIDDRGGPAADAVFSK